MRTRLLLLALLSTTSGCQNPSGISKPDLHGRVTIDGQPAAGISVIASTATSQVTVGTAADGRYEFSQLPRGSVSLTVSGQPADVLFERTVQGTTLDGVTPVAIDFFGFGPVQVAGAVLWSYGPALQYRGVPGVVAHVEGSPFPVVDATTSAAGAYGFARVPGYGIVTVAFGALPAGLRFAQNKSRWSYTAPTGSRVYADTTYAIYDPAAALFVQINVDGQPFYNADVSLATPLPVTSRSNYFVNLPVLPIDVRISGFPAAIVFTATLRTVQLRAGVTDSVVFTGYTPGANHLPIVSITAPTNGATFNQGSPITFQGSATDDEDGVLSGASLEWRTATTLIGTGTSFTRSDLQPGPHRIALRATDKVGGSSTAVADITVLPATGGRITGTVTVGSVPRAGVRMTLSTSPARFANTDAQGVYLFDNVAPGTYVVTLEPPPTTAFPVTTQQATVTSGVTLTLNFAGFMSF